jgi:aminoglycoside 3-N-acetyltransferase
VVTRADLETGLRALGLTDGDIVEVHSSLSAFGRVEGGADTVVDALTGVVGPEGTIVMSAYRVSPPVPVTPEEAARGIDWKVRILSAEEIARGARTGMGAVADTFLRRQGVVCGAGVHRTAAWGREAERHTEGFERLVEQGGRVLLLGVDIYRCSSLHIAESVPVPDDIEAYFRVPDEIRRDYPAGVWGVGYGNGTPEDAWGKVYAEIERRGLVRRGTIGRADCRLFPAREAVDRYAAWRREDPYGLFGVPRSA